jgi:hypothetical protein
MLRRRRGAGEGEGLTAQGSSNVHWQTVFSVESAPEVDYLAVLIGGGFAVIGVLLATLKDRTERPSGFWGNPRRMFGAFWATQALFFLAIAIFGTYLRQESLIQVLRTGHVEVVEGDIEHFQPMPEGCHAPERFDVAGHRFAYKDCFDAGGFNQSSTKGGPLEQGQHVRIFYRDGLILKLQLAEPR